MSTGVCLCVIQSNLQSDFNCLMRIADADACRSKHVTGLYGRSGRFKEWKFCQCHNQWGCKCFDRSAQLVVHHCKPYHVAGACFGKNDGWSFPRMHNILYYGVITVKIITIKLVFDGQRMHLSWSFVFSITPERDYSHTPRAAWTG